MAPPEVKPLIGYAHSNRPDIIATEFAVKQAEAGIRVAEAGYYPTINLAGNLDSEKANSYGFENEDFGSTISLNLSWNLFAGGFTRARVRENREGLVEAQSQLAELRINVASEVRDSAARVRASQEQLLIQRANAALVQKNRDLVEKEYQAGQTSLVRLNEAQRDLTTAQSRLVLALVSLRQAWFDLEADMGRILDYF
jgi:outer membrane protein TolC